MIVKLTYIEASPRAGMISCAHYVAHRIGESRRGITITNSGEWRAAWWHLQQIIELVDNRLHILARQRIPFAADLPDPVEQLDLLTVVLVGTVALDPSILRNRLEVT
jgi:hypothetical protein